jgi:predicted Na+-dependent transporter
MQMFVYVALHALFGLIAGILFNYLRNESASKISRWLAYLAGISGCLAIAAVIGDLSSRWHVKEFYQWIGALVVLMLFFTAVAGSKLAKNARQRR